MPSNYIIFLKNLKEYINMDMKFIKPEDSKYKEYISYKDKRFGSYPMGKLNDIEIHFLHCLTKNAEKFLHSVNNQLNELGIKIQYLHYKSPEEAYEKWNRRRQRINFKNLIVKFND